MKRRDFIRVAAAAAAATGSVGAGAAVAQQPPRGRGAGPGGGGGGGRGGGGGGQEAPPIPLDMGDAPAIQFQAYPGGTGALMEKLIRERGAAAFDKKEIPLEPWTGPVPTNEVDLAFLPAHRIGALIQGRHITSMDITEIYLERLHRFNDTLTNVVTFMDGRAREEAQQADMDIRNGNWRGPLHGVPYGVKDLFSTRGYTTQWGHADFANQMIDEDAELVVRLRNAGAVLLAKLTTGEFAQGDRHHLGRTLNPWNTEQGSSGSSAGPGSATAAGLVGFSIGTETQGSISSPSGRNGLSALRPTFGRVSRHGGMVLSWTMDKPGPMCRSIEDCAHVFNAMHGADPKDPSTVTAPFEWDRRTNLQGVRIGYQLNDEGQPQLGGGMSPEQTEEVLATFRRLGATVGPLPELPNVSTPSISIEGAAAFDFYITQKLAAMEQGGEDPGNRFQNGRDDLALDYIQAQRRRLVVMKQWEGLTSEFDAWFGYGGATHSTGHPLVVLPYRFGTTDNDTHEQPRTMTMWGQVFQDDLLLEIAHAFQMTGDWHTRRPALTS